MPNDEVDISDKANKIIKYGLISMLIIGFAIASAVWALQSSSGKMVIQDAKIATSMVGIRAQTDGEIEEILVGEGDTVEAGTVVARLKVNVTEEQIKQLEQTVELSKGNLEQVKRGTMVSVPVPAPSVPTGNADLAAAKKRLERMNQLLEMGAISTAERDAAAADVALAESAAPPPVPEVTYTTIFQPSSPEMIKNAEMAVRQAEMALELAKTSAQATEVKSDVAGVAYVGDLKAGDKVQPGQLIMNVGAAESLWVEAYVNISQVHGIGLGDLAYFKINGKEYKGTVMDIVIPEPPAESSEGSTDTEGVQAAEVDPGRVTVKISVPQEAFAELQPEQRAEVTLHG